MTEKQILLLVLAILGLAFSVFAFKRPELFLKGRRSKFWLELLGEEGAKKVARFVGVPLMVFVSLFLLMGALGIIHLS